MYNKYVCLTPLGRAPAAATLLYSSSVGVPSNRVEEACVSIQRLGVVIRLDNGDTDEQSV